MQCPVCPGKALHPHSLDESLIASKCDGCGGQWINSFQYWMWLESHPRESDRSVSLLSFKGESSESSETAKARLCPECGHILTRYRVGQAVDFTLDRCGNCGGMWFDRNEWEILRSGELRDQIHLIFSASWQNRVREESSKKRFAELFEARVGEQDYRKAREFKAWLEQHPHRDELLSFLNSKET